MPKKSAHELYIDRNNRNLEQRLRYKYSVMKAHAAERGIAWSLTFEDVLAMWKRQNGKCGYTNQRMTITIGRGLLWRNWSVSIDRLDPSKPYSKDNVVLCRFDANSRKAKRNFFDVEFMETFPDHVANVLRLKPNLNQLAA